jgi:nitrate/nitrite transporter NarK
VVVYGASNGVATLTRATTVSELYGAEHYGSISAVIAAVGAIGGAGAPFVAAYAIELVGRDTPVFVGFVVVSLLAAAANEVVAAPTRRQLRA